MSRSVYVSNEKYIIRVHEKEYEDTIKVMRNAVGEEKGDIIETYYRKNFDDKGAIRIYKLAPGV